MTNSALTEDEMGIHKRSKAAVKAGRKYHGGGVDRDCALNPEPWVWIPNPMNAFQLSPKIAQRSDKCRRVGQIDMRTQQAHRGYNVTMTSRCVVKKIPEDTQMKKE
ncbi:hypothetical protein PoB_004693400 [Plakobranchus ocellatus]|uniref:Uncharacterized protein n=1 Tax=Plakobranchus ocellatus TaxID=259542 RepID=A0AAV4BQ38_9GAST|nr:hypothetical protein PoB_004693400 [Plakobranchus ocellatus]